jgi:SAM-dependent methyltransferase
LLENALNPWPLKIAAKLVLSRLPVSYRTWTKLGFFRHGEMASLPQPQRVFDVHMAQAREGGVEFDGSTVLEMGTGDSIASALLARKSGASRTYLLDVGDFATRDMDFYRQFSAQIDLAVPNDCSYDELLDHVGAVQLTSGLASWKSVPSDSLDFVWSHSTLEHVRKSEFDATMAEMFRCMKPGAVASHNIHLKDHLGGALNNLRFSEELWEADWWAARSGFYTNRLRPSDLLKSFRSAGFDLAQYNVAKWEKLPTPRHLMAPQFREMPEEDLLATGVQVLLRK